MDQIDGMRTFIAVAECKSFTAAGKRLGISNKLVSKYIGALEARLHIKLVHRTTRSLSISNEGQRYLEGCRRVLEEIDALEDSMRMTGSLYGQFKIAAPLTYGETIVSGAVVEFQKKHPEVVIEIEMSDKHVDLAEGGFDLAVRMGSLKDSSLIAQKIASSKYITIASPKYLELFGSPKHPSDLSSHMCIRDSNNIDPHAWPYFDNGQLIHIPVKGPYIANSAPACLSMAVAHRGIYHCPEVFLKDEIKSGHLKQLFANFPSRELTIYAVHLPSSHKNPKVIEFVRELKKSVK